VIVVLKLESDARAPDPATAYESRCAGFPLLVTQSPPSRNLLPKLAAFAALDEQQVDDTAALILEKEATLPRLVSKLRQQRLDPRDVVEPDAQVEVTMFSGLPPQQRIDAPAAVNPVVDPTGVKGSQDLYDVLKRHPVTTLGSFICGTYPRLSDVPRLALETERVARPPMTPPTAAQGAA